MKHKGLIVIIEIIIIVILFGFILSNFIDFDKSKNKEEIEYLNGRYYIKDLCEDSNLCKKNIGVVKIDKQDFNLSIDLKEDYQYVKADDKEFYKIGDTKIDYIEIIKNNYILVHQKHENGTYQTDLYNKKFDHFFHIISRKPKTKDTDMWVTDGHILNFYDYACTNLDKRYATKYKLDLYLEKNAPIVSIEKYDNDYMPNCNVIER